MLLGGKTCKTCKLLEWDIYVSFTVITGLSTQKYKNEIERVEVTKKIGAMSENDNSLSSQPSSCEISFVMPCEKKKLKKNGNELSYYKPKVTVITAECYYTAIGWWKAVIMQS